MNRIATPTLLACLAGMPLLGCSDDAVRKFGTTREGLEEVRVTPRPALSVPPVLMQRPPRAGAAPADDAAPPAAAAKTDHEAAVSPGQDALLSASGPSAPSNIRQRVDQDAQIRRQDSAFTDELVFSTPGVRQTVEGRAPTIEQGGKSWFSSIF